MIHEVLISLENRHGKDALIRVRRVVEIWRGRAKRVRPSDIMQKPQLYFPDLSANAWHDPAQFPFVKNLEESAPQIRSELEHVLMDSIAFEPYHQQKLIGITDGNWNAYHFRRAQSWLANSVEKCPTTFSALQQVSRSAGTAMFSAVSPGGHIAPHCGPWNCRLTFHLGLAIPAESEMRVGTEMRSWREGKCLAFDDSFEHEVWNRSGSARYILLFDIWHPDLSDIEIRFLEAIQQTLHAAEF